MNNVIPLVEEPDPSETNREAQVPTLELETIPSVPLEKTKPTEEKFHQALSSLLKSTGATYIQALTNFTSFTSLIYFVSLKHDTKMIGYFGLGTTIQFVFVVSFIIALNQGLSTVGSQAFGAGNYKLLGLYYKRAIVILMLVVIPMAILLMNSSKFFLLIGVEKELAAGLQDVLVHLLPSSVAVGLFDAGKNYLVAQKIFGPQSMIQMISIGIDLLIQYTFIVRFDLGFLGIGLARFMDEAGKFTMLCIYVKFSKQCQETTVPWSRECFKGLWKQFMDQLSAGGLMILDIFGSQLVLMQVAYLNEYQQAANIIGTRVVNFCLLFTWSLQTALSAFVGNSIGEANEKKMLRYTKAGLLVDGILVLMTWVFVGTQGGRIARIFSNDQDVIHYVEGLIGLYMLISPVDNLQCILGGVLRSAGKGKSVSRLFMITYYPVSIPVSFLLAHYLHYEIYGLYMTIFIVKGVNAVMMVVMFKKLNIQEQIAKVLENVKEDEKSMHEPKPSDMELALEETETNATPGSKKHLKEDEEKAVESFGDIVQASEA